MTVSDFNEKYQDYLGERHYGLDINIPSVIEYLDKIFPILIEGDNEFKYYQIKLKFNNARFYADNNCIGEFIIEKEINRLVKEFDEIQSRS